MTERLAGSRYVALGSSMAAGPGIAPRDKHAPLRAARSAANYPHLAAQRLGLDLVDVTYSGATTADVLTDRRNGEPPQVTALDGSESLVTITIGGNDVGYVPLLTAAALPHAVRSVPVLGDRVRELVDPAARDRDLVDVAEKLENVGREVRSRAPRARVLFVDYLTLLPPAGEEAAPLSGVEAALGRRVAATLERLTAEAAKASGCGLVRASDASRAHHPWSADPWTTKPSRYGLPIPGRPFPAHPNAAGMRAVAELVAAFPG
jgi:lysophospholipase L1-like esterase